MQRDTGAIRGIRAHLPRKKPIHIAGVDHMPDAMVALFEEHLQALDRVEQLTIQRRVAVAQERAIEARVLAVHAHLREHVALTFGKRSPRMREFGLAPHKKPRMTAKTKKLANDKRQATRKERGILGKKQRAAWKKKRRDGGT